MRLTLSFHLGHLTLGKGKSHNIEIMAFMKMSQTRSCHSFISLIFPSSFFYAVLQQVCLSLGELVSPPLWIAFQDYPSLDKTPEIPN